MVDGILSSTVHAILNSDSPGSQMDSLELMDQLYSSECFTRQQDKVIFETAQTLKEYAETIVIFQIALAFGDALYHFISVIYLQEIITDKMLVTASALFGVGEFVAAAVGVAAYIDVTSQFSAMYGQMNSAGGTGTSQACVSSCCLPPGLAVATSTSAEGMSAGAIAGIAAFASITFLGGVWCCIRSEITERERPSGGSSSSRSTEMTHTSNPVVRSTEMTHSV
jgi:hypothetical protein